MCLNPLVMPVTLGIILYRVPLTDEQAKLIASYILGLTNEEVSACLLYKPSYIRNLASGLYYLLSSGKCPQSLARKGELGGFDGYGYFHGKDVFTDTERRLLIQYVPRLALETEIMHIEIVPLKSDTYH